jgi:septum formation protein
MNEVFDQLSLFTDIKTVRHYPARLRQKSPTQPSLTPFHKPEQRYSELVLASGSPSKCETLTRLGLKFVIDPANIDERSFIAASPEILVAELAAAKGIVVSERHKNALVISADTVIVGSRGAIGKPLDRVDALRILTELNGRTHRVLTGLMIFDVPNNRRSYKLVTTEVRFRQQSVEALARYVATGEPMGKAGAYALQGMGALLIQEITGEYTNVLGLPVCAFVDALAELEYELI